MPTSLGGLLGRRARPTRRRRSAQGRRRRRSLHDEQRHGGRAAAGARRRVGQARRRLRQAGRRRGATSTASSASPATSCSRSTTPGRASRSASPRRAGARSRRSARAAYQGHEEDVRQRPATASSRWSSSATRCRARAVIGRRQSGDPKSKHFRIRRSATAPAACATSTSIPAQLTGHTERAHAPSWSELGEVWKSGACSRKSELLSIARGLRGRARRLRRTGSICGAWTRTSSSWRCWAACATTAGTVAYLEMNVKHWADHGFGMWMLRDAASSARHRPRDPAAPRCRRRGRGRGSAAASCRSTGAAASRRDRERLCPHRVRPLDCRVDGRDHHAANLASQRVMRSRPRLRARHRYHAGVRHRLVSGPSRQQTRRIRRREKPDTSSAGDRRLTQIADP